MTRRAEHPAAVRGHDDGLRDTELRRSAGAAQMQPEDHIRSVVGSGGGTAAEIEKANQLLSDGAITKTEYEAIKQKALA